MNIHQRFHSQILALHQDLKEANHELESRADANFQLVLSGSRVGSGINFHSPFSDVISAYSDGKKRPLDSTTSSKLILNLNCNVEGILLLGCVIMTRDYDTTDI